MLYPKFQLNNYCHLKQMSLNFNETINVTNSQESQYIYAKSNSVQ